MVSSLRILKEIFLPEAQIDYSGLGLSPEMLQIPIAKLPDSSWENGEEDPNSPGVFNYGGSVLGNEILIDIKCQSIVTFNDITGRAGNRPGWIVDTEIYGYDTNKPAENGGVLYFYHNERTFSDENTARKEAVKMATWVKARTLSQLADVKKSGDLAMSKHKENVYLGQ